MKISTEIGSFSKQIGEEKTVEAVAKAGFDAWDFTMVAMCPYDWASGIVLPTDHPLAGNQYLAFARKLRQIGLDNGISCNQSHAPFPIACPQIRSHLKRALECTAEAGGNICVIHPDNHKSPEENAEIYAELLPFAKDCGVKIATENMWNWDAEKDRAVFAACATPESYCAHLDAVDDENFVACLDIGHAEMMGDNVSAAAMIRALGNRLAALHIHDNDRHRDLHQIPGTMQIDFDKILLALKEVDYCGYFTLEANRYVFNFPEEDTLVAIQNLANAAKKLVNRYEQFCKG